jgi:hypothetical protein
LPGGIPHHELKSRTSRDRPLGAGGDLVTTPGEGAVFRIWARIEHIGPNEFFVIASAVPKRINGRATVLTQRAPSRDEADRQKARLLFEVAKAVRARGDRVVDTE